VQANPLPPPISSACALLPGTTAGTDLGSPVLLRVGSNGGTNICELTQCGRLSDLGFRRNYARGQGRKVVYPCAAAACRWIDSGVGPTNKPQLWLVLARRPDSSSALDCRRLLGSRATAIRRKNARLERMLEMAPTYPVPAMSSESGRRLRIHPVSSLMGAARSARPSTFDVNRPCLSASSMSGRPCTPFSTTTVVVK